MLIGMMNSTDLVYLENCEYHKLQEYDFYDFTYKS